MNKLSFEKFAELSKKLTKKKKNAIGYIQWWPLTHLIITTISPSLLRNANCDLGIRSWKHMAM